MQLLRRSREATREEHAAEWLQVYRSHRGLNNMHGSDTHGVLLEMIADDVTYLTIVP